MTQQAPRRFRFVWRDGAFVPDGNYLTNYCHDEFGEGEVVIFERHEDRSDASHRHYFACISEAWHNLPEADERFPTPEALRKWALIKAGYCIENSVACDSEEQAKMIAAFMGNSEGVILVVRDTVVKRYTAKSQSLKAMNKQEFQQSKNDVLDIIAELIAVSKKRLLENTGRAA
jgi:hypothetical protein